jgi:hypothetical protein
VATADATAAQSHRTYGNWRRPTSPGIGNLGLLSTVLLFAGFLAVIITLFFGGVIAAVIVGGVLGVVFAGLNTRDRHHRTTLQRVAGRGAFWRTRTRGRHLYRSGPVGWVPTARHTLPGLAAGSEISEAEDAYGRRFALLRLPSRNDYAVTFSCEPDGASLVDAEQVDSWVAHWGNWLASLGDEPGLVGAQVTVETAPDFGTRLRREVENNLDPDAPTVAQAMLRDVVESYPAGSATVRAFVTLTFTGTVRGVRRDPEVMARDLAVRLPALSEGLHATGAGAARPVTARELAELVRTAYDPAAAHTFDAARAAGEQLTVDWADVGPTAAQATWDHYRHDSGVSVTWGMTEAPRGEVLDSVLATLLSPHRDIDRKRVALLYRPLAAGAASDAVVSDVNAATFRAQSARPGNARTATDLRKAERSALEEAQGAGVTNFSMLVTATVSSEAQLPLATAAIDSLAPTARIRLRVLHGSQDSAFTAALPLGIVVPRHLRVPTELRNAL